jgi:selenophosphate synthetase-related protein
MPPYVSDLDEAVRTIREAPGLASKRHLDVLGRFGSSVDGDDAAAIPRGDGFLLVGGEAIWPPLLEADPFAAGAAAAVTSVSDIRAMGGRPLALVDTVVARDREQAERVIDGLAWGADLMGTPVAGGHLTVGGAPSLSIFATGEARVLLRASAARPGDALLAAFCLDGEYRGDAPFFSSLRSRSPEALREDGEALAEVAERGLCHAARDVSMPGVAGSLIQLLELAGCGAHLDLDRLPRPRGVSLEKWLVTFPSFGFVLAAPRERAAEACAAFTRRGLACAECGRFTEERRLTVATGADAGVAWDLEAEALTGLGS